MEMQKRLNDVELENVFGGIEINVYEKVEYRPNGAVVVDLSKYCPTLAPLICEENGEKYYYVLPFCNERFEETIII